MSRRTRGLFLTACSTVGWTVLKGDVKAAFLQGQESEEQRQIFAKPVKELNEKLGGNEKSFSSDNQSLLWTSKRACPMVPVRIRDNATGWF